MYPEYKANRKAPKPPLVAPLREYYLSIGAEMEDTLEADDLCGLNQEEDTTCIVSSDKDLLTVPGWHYNFLQDKLQYMHYMESLYKFYTQLLTGDPTDNIKGANGIGTKKAARILSHCETEQEMYEACLDHFSCFEELDLNATCLWIQRKGRLHWYDPFGS